MRGHPRTAEGTSARDVAVAVGFIPSAWTGHSEARHARPMSGRMPTCGGDIRRSRRGFGMFEPRAGNLPDALVQSPRMAPAGVFPDRFQPQFPERRATTSASEGR